MGNPLPLQYIMKVIESPDILVHGMRHVVRRRLLGPLDFRRADGLSRPPAQVGLKLVNACNLRCKMCSQWGETGYNFIRPAAELRELVPLAAYQKLIDDIAGYKPWMYVWGGEPFLYREIMSLIAYMKRKGLLVSITTNGTKLGPHAKELVTLGTDILLFSIDGPKDTHDDIRGYKGAFDLTVSALKEIQAEKKRQRKAKPYIVMVSVVTSNNQSNLEDLYEIAEEIGIDMMMTYYAWFQTEESGARYTQILEDKMGITPWSWRGYLWNVNEIDPQAVAETVQRLKSRRWSFPYAFFPELKPEEIAPYYRQHGHTFGHTKCVAPWTLCGVMPNGDVVTCRDYPDVVLGNIQQESLLDIWNSQQARTFRQLLQGEGLLPICSRCEGLMDI